MMGKYIIRPSIVHLDSQFLISKLAERAAADIALCGGEVVRRMGVVGVGVPSHSGSHPLKNGLMPLEIGCQDAWY